MLFLDDSGKPDTKHQSRSVVIAGFSMPAEAVPTLSRRVLGAKSKFHGGRGIPSSWEIKAGSFIKPNPWKRSKNRQFAFELARIVGSLGGTFYSVALAKANMNHAMTLSATTPLQLQALVEHFEVECSNFEDTGVLVADWSSHHADQHASSCVASFVASRRLKLHPSIYYASSTTTQAIQVADLVAGARRRVLEGDKRLAGFNDKLVSVRSLPDGVHRTHAGRRYEPHTVLF